MSNVVSIQKPFAPDDIPSTLRRIADEIEAGEYGLRTTCLAVLGHTEERLAESGDKLQRDDFELFGIMRREDQEWIRERQLLKAITDRLPLRSRLLARSALSD